MNSNYTIELPVGSSLTKVTENKFNNTGSLIPKQRLIVITRTIRVIEITFFLVMASWGNLPHLSNKVEHKPRFYCPTIAGNEQTIASFNTVGNLPLESLHFQNPNA